MQYHRWEHSGADDDSNVEMSSFSEEHAMPDHTTWVRVIYKFAMFLGRIYGYNIVKQIQINGESLENYTV